MTAMVRNEHKRSMQRQLLATDDRKAMRDREIASQQRKTSMMRETLEQTALASHAAEPLARRQTGIAGRLKIPVLHEDRIRKNFAEAASQRIRQNNQHNEIRQAP